MTIRFCSLSEENLPAVARLLLPSWQRNWDPDLTEGIFRWRFLQRKEGESILAMDGENCVAMIDSWCRQYVVDGEMLRVRELCDWFSLPEYRGIGLQPIRMMMKRNEPIISIGGSPATQAILPRLGWSSLAPASDYTMPLTTGMILERVLKHKEFPGKAQCIRYAHKIRLPLSRPRVVDPPRGCASTIHFKPGVSRVAVVPPAQEYALIRAIETPELDWLYSAPPEMGEFQLQEYTVDDKVVGFSISRLYQSRGILKSNILHLQTSSASVELLRWMLGETALVLKSKGACSVSCRTTCTHMANALRQLGFIKRLEHPTSWWSSDQKAPGGPIFLSRFRADDSIHPYPE
ncbi:hypothetical protein [Haliea sp. E17]|uniref:hypothetical protein n=1 Tax=Haliea sp. E17 TaxID=3401576 RepID=UPI003AABD48C